MQISSWTTYLSYFERWSLIVVALLLALSVVTLIIGYKGARDTPGTKSTTSTEGSNANVASSGSIKNPKILYAVGQGLGNIVDTEPEVDAVRNGFPHSQVWIERGITDTRFRTLIVQNKFDIVILTTLVLPDGSVTFGQAPYSSMSIPAEGIVKLLQSADAKLLILASCNSVPLATSLANKVDMIAATGDLFAGGLEQFLSVFFRLLGSGRPLPDAFETARDSMAVRDSGRVPTSKLVLMARTPALVFRDVQAQ